MEPAPGPPTPLGAAGRPRTRWRPCPGGAGGGGEGIGNSPAAPLSSSPCFPFRSHNALLPQTLRAACPTGHPAAAPLPPAAPPPFLTEGSMPHRSLCCSPPPPSSPRAACPTGRSAAAPHPPPHRGQHAPQVALLKVLLLAQPYEGVGVGEEQARHPVSRAFRTGPGGGCAGAGQGAG